MSCLRDTTENSKNKGGNTSFFGKVLRKLPCFGNVKESPGPVLQVPIENIDDFIAKSTKVKEAGVVNAPESDKEIGGTTTHELNTLPDIDETPKLEREPILNKAEVDRAEFGLKLLYDGEGAEVDIVTVHGLNGHREKTFTASNGICWLDSLLPAVIPKIRVLSYGYDARTHSSSPLSREHLHGHAEQLVEKLTRKRKVTKTTDRPIVFIAHSLGGIVVKSALILSESFNISHLEDQKAVSLSTYGILFMGTPHAGGGGVSWGRLALNLASIVKHTNPEYLDILERNSQWLEQQQVQYNSISSKFDTKFFYETYETSLPGGGKLLVVPRHSACVPGARDAALVAMSSDHSNMVKFKSAEEDDFLAVAETLEIMVQEARKKVDANWREWETIKAIGQTQKISYSIPMSLPFAMNQNFTGRQTELLTMHEILRGPKADLSHQRIMVLHGLGGMGKTQLATQYAYTYEKDYTSIWWVNAKTTATLSQDFLRITQRLITHHAQVRTSTGQKPDYSWIGTMLGLPPHIVDETGRLTALTDNNLIIEAAKLWLADKDNQKWLLIIDNYDDLENVDIADFLPTHSTGSVIITSRARNSQRLGSAIEVKEVEEEEGIEILRKSAQTKIEEFDGERNDAIDIVQKLGALPLALDQAGSYISSMQIPYSQYLSRLNSAFRKIAAMRPPRYVWQYREDTVFTTWEISFAALGTSAQELLLLCGFLDNEDIWEGLLPSERLKELGIDSVEDAIREIFSLSLAKRKNLSDSFWIHSMVHKWSQERLDKVEKGGKATSAVSLTSAAVSFGDDREELHHLTLERRLLPHVRLCANHICRDNYLDPVQADLKWLKEIEVLRTVLLYHQQLSPAQDLTQWTLFGYEKALGGNHPDTLAAVNCMGVVLEKRGRYDNALEWYKRALTGREEALSRDHPDTLTTVNCMASALDNQGKYDEALEWYKRALSGREKILGTDHRDTLTTIDNMALVLNKQARYDDALELFARVLAGREKNLSNNHPDTLTTIINMALVFHFQGKYDDALQWYMRALAGREAALGEDHPDTLAAVGSLALILHFQGKNDDALELYKRVLAGREKALGKDHPDTLTTVNNMVLVFQGQGKYEEALRWCERALVGREKVLGKEHPDTVTTIHNMAFVYDFLGKYDDAIEWYGRVLASDEKTLGKDHPDTLTTVDGMASVFNKQGKYEDAIEWYSRVLTTREKSLGEDHPDTLFTVDGMAKVFNKQGEYAEALNWCQRALTGREKVLGQSHPDTLTTVHNMATVLGNLGKYGDALELFERALAGREHAIGKDHPATIATRGCIAEIKRKLVG